MNTSLCHSRPAPLQKKSFFFLEGSGMAATQANEYLKCLLFIKLFFKIMFSRSLYGDQAKFFEAETKPRLKHKARGTVSMANNGDNLHGSQVS